MKICIVGWYGTETLGDRAILDGIIRIFSSMFSHLEISIASLYPVVTLRTILEDKDFWNSHSPDLEISTFCAKDKRKLRSIIQKSDWIIMGGGPLMDFVPLDLVCYAFKYAKEQGKRTGLIGCGYGPLKEKDYIKYVQEIARLSDVIIMRSNNCRDRMIKVMGDENTAKVSAAPDPAAISVTEYYRSCAFERVTDQKDGTWIMNIRDYLEENRQDYYPSLKQAVKWVAAQVPQLKLMPMHTFSVGGDDRIIQNKIAQELNQKNITVIQKPLSLVEAYELVLKATGCIGMRYHSILFQTYLNGNNYMIDYTNAKTGKVGAFINMIDGWPFYQNRYINLLESGGSDLEKLVFTNKRYECDMQTGVEGIKLYSARLFDLVQNDE